MRFITRMLVCGFVALSLATPAVACPNCKQAVAEQQADGARIQDGYSYSILFMMSMPLLLTGAGGFAVYRAARRGGLPEL